MLFQDDFPEDKDNTFLKQKYPPGHFHIVYITPSSLALVDAVIAKSADFDRALAEKLDATSDAYGDLVQAKGKLVEYIAKLMDTANNPAINQSRSAQVRFE